MVQPHRMTLQARYAEAARVRGIKGLPVLDRAALVTRDAALQDPACSVDAAARRMIEASEAARVRGIQGLPALDKAALVARAAAVRDPACSVDAAARRMIEATEQERQRFAFMHAEIRAARAARRGLSPLTSRANRR